MGTANQKPILGHHCLPVLERSKRFSVLIKKSPNYFTNTALIGIETYWVAAVIFSVPCILVIILLIALAQGETTVTIKIGQDYGYRPSTGRS